MGNWLEETDGYAEADEIVEASEILEECEEIVGEQQSQENAISPEKEEFLSYLVDDKWEDALFHFCFAHNYIWDAHLVKMLIKDKNDIESIKEKLPEVYTDIIKSEERYANRDFFSQLHRKNFERVYDTDNMLSRLSEDDKKNRQQIISIIGYDPFERFPDEEKSALYRDLTGMLSEAMRKDVPRAKAAVEVITGYNNIRKYNDRVTDLVRQNTEGTPSSTIQEQIDDAMKMINSINKSIADLVNKYDLSKGGKGVGSNGRGTLSDVMETVDVHMFDEGITNFYDIATSQSLGEVADISFKSMLQQVKLTGQDYSEILIQQAEIVKKAQLLARQAEEARRIAMAKLTKQELIEELREEYKKKNINPEDIEEFISREYKMWDGKNND